MKESTKFIIALVLIASASTLQAAPGVGDPAPAFNLRGSDGSSWSLEQFRDKKAVVIAFFPKVFTGG